MATMSTTPPVLQGPSAKEKKYDRQLRLWAASGQQALEDAHVLLLSSAGSHVAGIETLKNLVLPGVGNFTIVDGEKVKEEDLGVNFFLDEGSLGRSRAQETCNFLMELNPEVNGYAVDGFPASFLQQGKDVLSPYTLIILTGPARQDELLRNVSKYASEHSIPFIYIHSVGFYSHFSVQLPAEFPIVDTHPDPASTQDLRLLNPWPELTEFMHKKTDDLETLSDHEHGHIPYLLLLSHYLDKWRATHDGKVPKTYKEKTVFRDMVKKGARRNNAEGGEENFDEAVGAVLKSLNPLDMPSGLREVLHVADCQSPRPESANFWIIAHAIRNFHSNHSALPLPGALPDMKAQSADYIRLQNIYKAKARSELSEVVQDVRSVEQKLGRRSTIEEKEIEAFCKGAAFVKLVKGRPIRFADAPKQMDWADRAKYICQELQDEESLLPIYLCFLAYDWFIKKNHEKEHIKSETEGPEATANAMEEYTSDLLDHIAISAGSDIDMEPARGKLESVAAEIERAGGGEVHNISALTGGMVAQEVIKIITKQYVPVDNTCVFDGIASKTAVFKL
ncbi:UBA/THIF-type NAD/FAD binding fold [Lasallia pustulata]|uniref:NEDD8-activating enzyme E1 regulatory subunit n=1 Tax=Lasallia pustulata TaxID=136370 RepID=A0A1W5D0J5_9LECA|nr:UBA/THIF-type NAD/FAD binding fold [Lasallia pustulata]